MWSSSSRCKVIKGVAEVWPWFMRVWWSADRPRDQRGEFTFPQVHICVWPPWMSWTNAEWSVQTSTNSYELGRLTILWRFSVIIDIADCFSCLHIINIPKKPSFSNDAKVWLCAFDRKHLLLMEVQSHKHKSSLEMCVFSPRPNEVALTLSGWKSV